jgi:hypothetical protein
MKLWLISQTENDGYDTYDSAVVAAESAIDAARVYPDRSDYYRWSDEAKAWLGYRPDGSTYDAGGLRDWVMPDAVTVRYIGEAADDIETGTVCASFNAG